MAQHILYGDGIHDDTAAIQEMIDSGVCELSLPAPSVRYLISAPLIIPSHFKLKLPRFAEIRLADGSNCVMLQNKTVYKPAPRLRECFREKWEHFWFFVDELSPDPEDACHDFEIEGGIWNYNNMHQRENLIYGNRFDATHYLGHLMFFYNVRHFRLSNMTFKDPANYAVMIDRASYFTVENIVFDFNDGNPIASNMDGIHLDGNCHYGVIRNLQGACYDDLVALNAHEGSSGDITNIEIDGLFAENCHSAVRLLAVDEQIRNVTVSNVFGTYYQYCIGLTKHYPGEATGCFDGIVLQSIHASKSERRPIQEAHMSNKNHHFSFLWIQGGAPIGSLTVRDLHRREYVNPVPTISIEGGTTVKNLAVYGLTEENYTDSPMPTIVNRARIERLVTDCLSPADIDNGASGRIDLFEGTTEKQ